MLTKTLPLVAGAVASEDADAGVVLDQASKKVLQEWEGKMLPMIDAWHGGHPNIERFDMAHIGKGEGNQAFSKGLYFADLRGTSKHYQDLITNKLKKKLAGKGYVKVGGKSYPILAHKWADIKQILRTPADKIKPVDKAEVAHILGRDARHDARAMENAVNFVNWKGWKKEADEERGMARAEYDAEAMMEMDYEPPDMYHGDPYGITQEGFEIIGPSGDPVSVTVNKDFSLDYYDETTDTVVHRDYPEGTPTEFMFFDLTRDTMAESVERKSFHIKNNAGKNPLQDMLLGYEVAPNRFEWLPPEKVNGLVGPEYYENDPFGGIRPISSRRMKMDGTIIDMRSTEYYDHINEMARKAETYNLDLENQIYEDVKNNYGSIGWDTSRSPEPEVELGEMYKVILHVDPDDMLQWDVPINEQPERLQQMIRSYIDKKNEGGRLKYTGRDTSPWIERDLEKTPDELMGMTGEAFYYTMRDLYGDWPFSEDLLAEGVQGMIYKDWRRSQDLDPDDYTYNYVMYTDTPIEILERGATSAPFLKTLMPASFGMVGAQAEMQEKRPFLERVTDPETYRNAVAPYIDLINAVSQSPVTQFVSDNLSDVLSSMEMPTRGWHGISRGLFGLANGEDLDTALINAGDVAGSSIDDNALRFGDYVFDKTNSPAAATAAYTGTMLGDLSNFVGP